MPTMFLALWWLWVGAIMFGIYLMFGALEPLVGYSVAFLIFGLPMLIMFAIEE